MTARGKLLSKLKALCAEAGLDFSIISQELGDFIGEYEVIDYCITHSPLISFPDTVVDIMVLSNKFLFDYEIKQKGALRHILPLRGIIEIAEEFMEKEDQKCLFFSNFTLIKA